MAILNEKLVNSVKCWTHIWETFLKKWFASKKEEDIWKKPKGQISVNGTISELTLDFYSIFPINNIQFTVPVPSKLKSNMTWKFFICHFKKKPKENCNIACNYVLQKNTFWRNIVPQKVFSKKINSTKHKATKTLYIF